MRITEKQLGAIAQQINLRTDSPQMPYKNGVCQVGNYHITAQCGGYALHKVMNPAGGVKDVLGTGMVPKAQLYSAICAFLAGLQTAAEAAQPQNTKV